MKEELEKNEQSLLVPFLVGGLVGAGIALLLAPKSGKELRKDIADMTSNTRDKINATVEKGKGLYRETAASVRNAIEAGKTAYVEEKEKHHQAA